MHKKAFKVVICDHLMPGGNGLSFLVDVREEFPQYTTCSRHRLHEAGNVTRSVNEAALYRYLLKPVSLPELVKTVQEAVKLHDHSAAMAN